MNATERAGATPTATHARVEVSVKGKRSARDALAVCGVSVIRHGRLMSVGEIFDEYWLERSALPDPRQVIKALSASDHRPDVFTFAQRVPDTSPLHPYYHEWVNYAVLPIDTFDCWFETQIPAAARRNVRAAHKRGIEVRVCPYDDRYVEGIVGIYNETPIRAGRRFWHYGKEVAAVRVDNGTYAERSLYLAAYLRDEMVGYLKVVWDRDVAAIMQILSKLAHRDARPNNALLAEAVRHCAERGVRHLLYEHFDYGGKQGDSLTRFKETNGFRRMDVPRYYVPLSAVGRAGLALGLQRPLTQRMPEWMLDPLRDLRSHWYRRVADPA